MYKYVNSKDVKVGYDFIKDIAAIDAAVFPRELQGEHGNIRARFEANKESYILAYHDYKIVGYICFFPITAELSERIRNEEKTFDDDIKPSDIIQFPETDEEKEQEFDMFLISVAVLPQHHGKGIGQALMKEYFTLISDKTQWGCKIVNMYSYAYTNKGAWLLDKWNFTEIKSALHSKSGHDVWLMSYRFDDFSAANIYTFVPFFIDDLFEVDSYSLGEKILSCLSLFAPYLEDAGGRNAGPPLCGSLVGFLTSIDDPQNAGTKSAFVKALCYIFEIEKHLRSIGVCPKPFIEALLTFLEGRRSLLGIVNVETCLDEERDEIFLRDLVHLSGGLEGALMLLFDKAPLREVLLNILKVSVNLSNAVAHAVRPNIELQQNLLDILKIEKDLEEETEVKPLSTLFNEALLYVAKIHNGMLELEKISIAEFDGELSSRIKRSYLGRDEFIFINELEALELDERGYEFDLYVFYYKHFYIAVLKFEGFGKDPTILLNQTSMNKIIASNRGKAWGEKLQVSESGEMEQNLTLPDFTDYFAEKIGAKRDKIRQSGIIRSITSLNRKPTQIHLAYMMACERYTVSGYITHRLTGSSFYEMANENHAQYNTNQIYASERNVAYIVESPHEDRVMHEFLIIFIMELLMLQLCAVYSVYKEIIDDLDANDFSNEIIEQINRRISNASLLWDVDNFTYLAAKKIHEHISLKFGILRLKEENKANMDTFEKIALVTSQKEAVTFQRFTSVFTFVSGFSALNVFVSLAVVVITGELVEETLWIIGINSFMILGILSLFMIFRKPWTKFLEKRRKQRREQ